MAEDEVMVEEIAASVEQQGLPWTAGETDLTPLSLEERRSHLGLIVTPEERERLASETQRLAAQEEQKLLAGEFAAPTAIDWRNISGANYVTPVKNQKSCGSCVSFCTCAVMESAVRIKLQNPNYNIDLSEAFMQFCGGGSCSGWGLTSGLDFAKSTGTTDEACMPYQPTNMNCVASRCSDWQNRLTKIQSYTGYATIAARKDAVASKGPLLAGMAVFNDFFAYKSGVYVAMPSTGLAGYHCITIVGYDDSQQCWILKNSWGAGWGDGGFCRIQYNQSDLLLDTSWQFYSVVPLIHAAWHGGVTVAQTYSSHHSQNAWAYFAGLGWRKIQTGAPDGVTNMLALFAQAEAKGRQVTIYADGDLVYQAYLL
jgi:C1A family cysteine protease